MRELTHAELDSWYARGCWPCCGGREWRAGPRGGVMVNIKCPRCGTEMNVLDPDSHWAQWMARNRASGRGFGQMLREPEGYRARPIPLLRRLRLHFLRSPP